MATLYWQGQAPAVAQVATGSIDSVDGTPANNTFTVTIGGVAISKVGDTDVATTAAALVALLNASTHPYFAAITWTNPSSGSIVGTADTAGVPFVAALTETGAGTGAVTDFAGTTASAGPNHWDTATNWSTGAVPVASDTVIIAEGPNICYGLAQSAVDLASLTILQTYTGKIGLRRDAFATSADGDTVSTAAPEYRGHYLDIESTLVAIGAHDGPGRPNGSGRIKLDLGVHATTVDVYGTARTQADAGLACVRLLVANSSSAVHVRKAPGGVGIAADEPGETSSLSLVSVSDTSSESVVRTGDGTTIVTWTQQGGQNTLRAAATVTAITSYGGTLTTEGTWATTTLTVDGGTVYHNATGTTTTVNATTGTLDLMQTRKARTLTTVNLDAGATIRYDSGVVTLTNKIAPVAGPIAVSGARI